ncbi:MAG: DUF1704 domain-containing protein [Hyphomonadaceae bacterium]|nr:DUF1704 domain-containing protein [Hyphomonadaceae bacterium]
MQLSPKSYANAVEAAALIRKAEKPIRILRSLSWDPGIGQEFVKSGASKLPDVEYPKFDGSKSRRYLEKARVIGQGDHPVFAWLMRVADKLELAGAMLEHTGTPEFYAHSKKLYGTPDALLLDKKTKTINLARHMDATLADLDFDKLVLGGEEVELSACEFSEMLGDKLAKHFNGNAPKIVMSDNLSAKVLAGSRRIRVRKDATFAPMDVHQLLQHEALVHTATALNGKAQDDFEILGAAHAGTTEIQEGLAVFAEFISGAMDPVRFRRLVDRVIAIQMSVEGADFIEVYKYFVGQNEEPYQAFEDTRRVFRGGVLTGGAPFTKDGVYLNGLLRVHNFMRSVVSLNRADLVRLLFVGKLDLEDVPALANLAANGKIKPAGFLPRWARDMRFLVSYLGYSSFLNQVKLPGLQEYYRHMLDEVPDIWDFHDEDEG